MRKTISLLLVLFLATGPFSTAVIDAQISETPQPAVVPFSLLDGTPVRLRLSNNLSSKDAKTGQNVDFEVLDDIKIGDVIVIPKQSSAIATITRAKPAGRLGRGGKLDVNIDYVRLVTGDKITLRAAKENKGDNRTGTMTTGLVAAGILFFPAAPLFLFVKGKNINIAKGTEVTAYVNGDFALDRGKFVSSPRTDAAEELTSVFVKSTPEGAEIEVDGVFVGSTPSTIQLKAGERNVVVKKSGFVTWERTISVATGSNLTLDATLERPTDEN
jgi:hypothetical protein